MGKNMQDVNDEHVIGQFVIDGQCFTKLNISNDDGPAAYAQRIRDAWDYKNQADIRIDQNIAESIKPAIAQSVRDGKSSIVQHLNKSDGIAFWRDVDHSIGSGRCHEDERRMSDEATGIFVDYLYYLCDRTLWGLTDYCSELFLAGDDIAKTMPKTGHIALSDVAGHPIYPSVMQS